MNDLEKEILKDYYGAIEFTTKSGIVRKFSELDGDELKTVAEKCKNLYYKTVAKRLLFYKNEVQK